MAAYLDMIEGDPLPELERWREEVEDALAITGTHALADLADEIRAGDSKKLFRVIADNQPIGVFVLRILQFPRARILDVWLVAGEGITRYEEALSQEVVRIAQSVDCDRAWGAGRDGWCRPGQRTGWRMVTRLMEYTL